MNLVVSHHFRNMKTAMWQPAKEKAETASLSSDFAENVKFTRKKEVAGLSSIFFAT